MIESFLIFLLVLSVLILFHEFGHFLVARYFGVWVEEFGWGLPPRIFGKKIGETIYSINALPIGGFVKLHGEMTGDNVTNPTRAFVNKPKKIKGLIIIAGVVMNFILAVLCFSIVYTASGVPQDTKKVKILEISTGSPAQISGLVIGDIVKKVDGKEVISTAEFISLVEQKKGKKAIFDIERKEKGELVAKKITVSPRGNPPKKEGPLGVAISTIDIYYPPLYLRPFYGVYYGFKESLFWGKIVGMGFVKIFQDLAMGHAPQGLSGPVGIFIVTHEAAKAGVLVLINFIGVFSVNLAIFNLLPFPALDGGRLLFVGLEKVLGKKVLPKVESTIHTIGMVILLALLFLISAREVKIVSQVGVSGFVDKMLR
ncbi:MAG: M50 family metallopeptidase [Patescibacteria group bacterium]